MTDDPTADVDRKSCCDLGKNLPFSSLYKAQVREDYSE